MSHDKSLSSVVIDVAAGPMKQSKDFWHMFCFAFWLLIDIQSDFLAVPGSFVW